MERNEDWVPINLLDLIPKSKWPRVIKVQAWEISSHGRFRHIDLIKQRYRYVKTIIVDGEKYFVAIIGSTGGNLVVKKWLVKELLEKLK